MLDEQGKLFEHTLQVHHHIRIRKSDHPVALLFKISASRQIIALLVAVRIAINLYDDHRLARGEIRDIVPNNLLSAKFDPLEALGAKLEP